MSDEAVLPDFSGKTVVVYAANAPSGIADGVVLEYPEFKRFNDRLFLIGRMAQIEGSWARNAQCGIHWDSVVHYLIFNSTEDFLSRAKPPKSGIFRWLLFGRST